MARKLYIKTFGCQMNEYDSAAWRTCWRSPSPGADRRARAGRCAADEHLLGAREGAGKSVLAARRVARAEARSGRDLVIGVGGCVASQEGEAIRSRAPFVDLVFGPQTLHRLPQMLDELRRARRRRSWTSASRDREVRPPAGAARRRRLPPSFRSWKAAASTALSAWCPTRAARKSAARSTTCSRRSRSWPTQGVREVTLLGPERQCLPRR